MRRRATSSSAVLTAVVQTSARLLLLALPLALLVVLAARPAAAEAGDTESPAFCKVDVLEILPAGLAATKGPVFLHRVVMEGPLGVPEAVERCEVLGTKGGWLRAQDDYDAYFPVHRIALCKVTGEDGKAFEISQESTRRPAARN